MADDSLEALVGELESLSPMPDDTELEADQVDRYDDLVTAISQELSDRFDERAVRALVYSFGIGGGYGVYWSTLHAIERFHTNEQTYRII
jgi:hypothetical protein